MARDTTDSFVLQGHCRRGAPGVCTLPLPPLLQPRGGLSLASLPVSHISRPQHLQLSLGWFAEYSTRFNDGISLGVRVTPHLDKWGRAEFGSLVPTLRPVPGPWSLCGRGQASP